MFSSRRSIIKLDPLSINSLIFSLAYFMTLAVFAIYLDSILHFSSIETASALMIASLCSKVTRVLVSPLLDKPPAFLIVVLSALIMSLSCVIISIAEHFIVVCTAMAMYGVAYGTNSILIRSIVGSATQASVRTQWFVRLSVLTNIASMTGPLIALYSFSEFSPIAPFLLAAVAMLIYAVYALNARKAYKLPYAQRPWITALAAQVKDPKIYHLFALTAFSWAIYSQLFTSVTIKINDISSAQQVGNILSFNAILCIFLAPQLQKLVSFGNVSVHAVICTSLILHSVGFLLMHFSASVFEFYGSVTVWTMGELLLIPTLQSSLAGVVDKQILVSALAINSIAMGLGEGVGSFTGVYLIKNTDACFLTFFVFSIATLAYVIVNRRLLNASEDSVDN